MTTTWKLSNENEKALVLLGILGPGVGMGGSGRRKVEHWAF